ncbi:MAG TPA: hypothetical protein VJA18_00920 [Candidatus Nanoarchaeia archaeon]|nr:hypothetical protein [Candidatus Nanoarchaeia archaeon]
MNLEGRLLKPVPVGQTSMPILGLTSGRHEGKQVVVLANYFGSEFAIREVTINEESVPELKNVDVISTEKSAAYDGGTPKSLWGSVADAHSTPRAEVGQVWGEKLFYLQNGGRELGRFDLKTGKVLEPLTSLEEPGRYFALLFSSGHILSIEGEADAKTWHVRTYVGGPTKNKLTKVRELDLGAKLLYGLCLFDDKVLVAAPAVSGLKDGAGIYRLGMGTGDLTKLQKFTGIPDDVRGLAPLYEEGHLLGFLTSTYDFNRSDPLLGAPSEIAFHRYDPKFKR